MERWISPELGRLLSLAGAGCLGFSVLLGFLVRKIRGGFKPFRKATMLYSLVALLVFALVGLTAGLSLFASYGGWHIFFQCVALTAGIVHLFARQRWLPWTGEGAFWPELLYVLVLAALGAVGLALGFRFFDRQGMELYMASACLFFIIPFFVYQTYLHAVRIPPPVFKKWFYPLHQAEMLPDEDQLKNLLVISFEFQKKPGDRHYTNFRAKAPVDMGLGELFYYFINDYNERHPGNGILYQKPGGEPDGWIFYKKPRWYQVFTTYVDTDKTIFINNIRENDIIVCTRVA
ncbi:MAG: TssN family type VI secretion system protein [Flavihumibacter sp.]